MLCHMCGIVGFTGKRHALPILLDGLTQLEYRGYDSAGVALETVNQGTHDFWVQRNAGPVSELRQACESIPPLAASATCGIAHTRWATHGMPSETNAHQGGFYSRKSGNSGDHCFML